MPQRQLWPSLAAAAALGFVLYGGTALSLRLGHRISLDFDFFGDQPLDRAALTAAMPLSRSATVLQDAPDTWSVLLPPLAGAPAEVKVSFFGGRRIGRVSEPERTADGVAVVASLDDLLATKLKVLLQRVEAKDYVDVAALLHAGVSLAYGLAGAQTLYGPNFQPSECLKALVYFQGGDLDTLSQQTRAALTAAVAGVGPLPPVARAAPTLI